MMQTSYQQRRAELEAYFDRTAVDAWAKLTSDVPVGSIRATVRAGRERMRNTLLSYLPEDLRAQRVLDAGCGTGALAVVAAQRGADVLAIDLSPSLVQLGRERMPADLGAGSIELRVSDMLASDLGQFDWVVAMDSLIHYTLDDMAELVASLAARARAGVLFTFAPRTPLLALMHSVGRVLPRGQRAPAIVPVAEQQLRARLSAHPALQAFEIGRTQRVDSGFYISNALELIRR
jgi:magnesium-protoporphyrin O-methyltransferase